MATTTNDPVNHPAHYTRFPVEVITITECLPFCTGNAVKYLCRAGAKDSTKAGTIQDLQKAAWYVAREIERITGITGVPEAKAPAKRRGRPAKAPAATSAAPSATEAPKRRGRPKGSKNRPKDAAPTEAPAAEMAVQDPAA
jgi:hypothetical protein